MNLPARRTIVTVAAALAVSSIPAVVVAAPSSADVPNCPNGWWDPWANTCRGAITGPVQDCGEGNWWNPVTNACEVFVIP